MNKSEYYTTYKFSTDLDNSQLQELKSLLTDHVEGKGNPHLILSQSPSPTKEQVQQFVDYMGDSLIVNKQQTYVEMDQNYEGDDEAVEQDKGAKKVANRHHHLSIIQVGFGI